ncbi:MAG: hypothetical protein ABIP53_12065 [Candidatus Limnocylindrales bacterium]
MTPPPAADVAATVPTGQGPCAIAEFGGKVWVTNFGIGTLTSIDPTTNEVVDEVDIGVNPCAIAASEDALWIGVLGEGDIVRFDPETLEVTDRLELNGQVWDVQFGHGSIWVSVRNTNELLRIDPDTKEIVERWATASQPGDVVVTPTEVWVAAMLGIVNRVDVETNEALPDLEFAGDPSWFAVSDDRSRVVLTLSNQGQAIVLDTATAEAVITLTVPARPRDPGTVGGKFCVTSEATNSVTIIDPVTGQIEGAFTLSDARSIWSAEGLAGTGWVLDFGANLAIRIDSF